MTASVKSIAPLALCLAWLACAHPQPFQLQGTPAPSITFAASSLGSNWTIRGALNGHVDEYDNGLRVVVYADTIVSNVLKIDPSGGPDSLRVALASGDTARDWRLEQTSDAVPLSMLTKQSGSRRDSADFVIRNVRRSDLSNRWIVFEFRSHFVSSPIAGRRTATTFLHLPRGVLLPSGS